MARWSLVVLALSCVALQIVSASSAIGEPLLVRAKRQQCRCVRLTYSSNGMQCSCNKPASGPYGQAVEENAQREQLASELSNTAFPQASCACIQIVFQGNPQYQCQCGESGTVTVPATTVTAETTTTTTTATTTTTTSTTTTTTTMPPTPPPETTVNTTPAYVSQVPTGQPGNGQCHCIMIHISGPSSAHYQCSCLSTPAPAQDDMTTAPATTAAPVETYPPQTMIPDTLPPVTTTPPTPEPIMTTIPQLYPSEETVPPQTYPLTTTCVMYMTGVQSTPCMCMPEYDPCAQNICCLKHKYRSLKHNNVAASLPIQHHGQHHDSSNPSTIDMLMNVLQKIKNKWD